MYLQQIAVLANYFIATLHIAGREHMSNDVVKVSKTHLEKLYSLVTVSVCLMVSTGAEKNRVFNTSSFIYSQLEISRGDFGRLP
jgi:hypothetical protein